MSRNGSGTYSLPSGNPVVTGTDITDTWANTTLNDIATALTASIAKDGQTTPTANLPMGGFKLTGLASGSSRTDSASIANIQDGTGFYCATVGGTSDVITLTPSPAFVAYTAGQLISFISSGANTTNVTVNVSALGAKAITKNGSTALVAGDIPASALIHIQYDGTQFQLVNVNVNPLSSITGLGTGVATFLGTPSSANLAAAVTDETGSGSLVFANSPTLVTPALGTPASGTLTNCTDYPTLTLTAPQATNTGTYIDVTGIPSTAKQININFNAVSTNGTSFYIIQIGDAGGIEPTGYGGNGTVLSTVATTTNFTTGFGIPQATGAGQEHYGTLTLYLVESSTNTWSCNGVTTESSGTRTYTTAGVKALSAALTQLRLTTVNGTDTFDAGSISVSYF